MMRLSLIGIFILVQSVFTLPPPPERARLWVASDYSARSDQDDRVVMSVLLLLANEFRLEGMALGMGKEADEKVGTLFKDTHEKAYASEFPNLSQCYSGFPKPEAIAGMTAQASTTPQGFQPGANISNLPTVQALLEAIRKGSPEDPLYVTLWGPTGDAGQVAEHIIEKEPELKNNVVFISHWTMPGKVNCVEDLASCNYLKNNAAQGKIHYIETGSAGATGLDDCKDGPKLSREVLNSKIATWMELKWEDGYPDWSDGSSWMTLLGHHWGYLDFKKLGSDATSQQTYLSPIYCNNRGDIYKRIEERARVAAGGKCPNPVVNISPIEKSKLSASALNSSQIKVFQQSGLDGSRLKITLTSEAPETPTLQIYNLNGTMMYQGRGTEARLNTREWKIETENFKAGTYILIVNTGAEVVKSRLVIFRAL